MQLRVFMVFIFTKKYSLQKVKSIYGQNSNFLSFHTNSCPSLIFALALALLMLVALYLQTT